MFYIKTNEKQVKKNIEKIKIAHDRAMKMSIGGAMTNTRLRASERIIENTTGYLNPRAARRVQEVTNGRLTSRTGKLKLMLEYGASKDNPLKSWDKTTLDKIIFKEKKNIGLDGKVRKRKSNGYIATYRSKISNYSRLYSKYGGVPPETKKTLAMRFQWEYGLKGNPPRPIFAPVINMANFDMTKLVKQQEKKLGGFK